MKYRHYKGGIYEIVCEARLESDPNIIMIVYKSEEGLIWTRPSGVFLSWFNTKAIPYRDSPQLTEDGVLRACRSCEHTVMIGRRYPVKVWSFFHAAHYQTSISK